jgi:hypothetical protein
LNFNERADLYVIADLTTVKVGEGENADIPSQFYVRRNPLERVVGLAHEWRLSGRCRSGQF